MERVTFRTEEDFLFEIGKEKNQVAVPRMTFLTAKKVIATIGNYVATDMAKGVEAAAAAGKVTISGGRAVAEYTKAIAIIIPTLLQNKNIEIIEKLLIDISEETITPEMVSQMQYEEAAKILSYLLEKNFEALKNLSASLQAISSYEK